MAPLAYVSIRQHTSGHTSAYVSIRPRMHLRQLQRFDVGGSCMGPLSASPLLDPCPLLPPLSNLHSPAYVSTRQLLPPLSKLYSPTFPSGGVGYMCVEREGNLCLTQRCRRSEESGAEIVHKALLRFIKEREAFSHKPISQSRQWHPLPLPTPHTSAYVSIRQHTSAYVSIRHTSAHVRVRRK